MMKSRPKMQTGSIFDIHVHLLGDAGLDGEFMEFARRWKMPFAVSCLGPEVAMLAEPTVDEIRKCNDMVLDLVDRNPGFAYGFCYVNPAHGNQAVEEIRRCVRDGGMVGIKLWVAVKCSDERAFPIAEEAIGLDVPILQHSYLRLVEVLPGESKPADIVALASRYPGMRMIMAHMAFRWREGVDTVRDYPNLLVDTCGFDPELGSIEYAVEKLGVDRVLFGSDAPGRDILAQLGKVMAAGIPEPDREKILRGNAERLLGLNGGAR